MSEDTDIATRHMECIHGECNAVSSSLHLHLSRKTRYVRGYSLAQQELGSLVREVVAVVCQ